MTISTKHHMANIPVLSGLALTASLTIATPLLGCNADLAPQPSSATHSDASADLKGSHDGWPSDASTTPPPQASSATHSDASCRGPNAVDDYDLPPSCFQREPSSADYFWSIFESHQVDSSKYTYYANVPYVKNADPSFSKSNFDLFVPTNRSGPYPLMIFLYGGGFLFGSKEDFAKASGKRPMQGFEGMPYLIDSGVAIAALNYPVIGLKDFLSCKKRVLEPMTYCLRGLQNIRHRSADFDIDKSRVALYGVSSGAGAALWIATMDDQAILDSPDPRERESSRVSGVALAEVQSSYDPRDLRESFADIEMYAWQKGLFTTMTGDIHLLGHPDMSMLDQVSSDDPDMWISNAALCQTWNFNYPEFKTNPNSVVMAGLHHGTFVKQIADRATAVGGIDVQHEYYSGYRTKYRSPNFLEPLDFVKNVLGAN